MSPRKVQKALFALLVFVGFASLVGMVLLILQAESAELAFIELLVFSISVIAVFLAVLGAITSVNQTRVMDRIARNMRETIQNLKELDAESAFIRRKLNQDYALAKDIAEALSDAGIMVDDSEKRKHLAGNIEKKIRKTPNR